MSREPARDLDSTTLPTRELTAMRRAVGAASRSVSARPNLTPVLQVERGPWTLDTMHIGEGQDSVQVLWLTISHVHHDGIDHYCLSVRHLRRDRDRRVVTQCEPDPGCIQFIDDRQDDTPIDHGTAALFLPCQMFDARVPEAASLHGRVIRNERAHALAHMVRTVPGYLRHLSEDAVDALAGIIRLLAFDTVGSALPEPGPDHQEDHPLLPRITKHIRSRLTDRTLTPAAICEEFAISRATLYRQFAHQGGVARYIKRERLGAIHARLSAGTDARPLMDIAHEFGFGSHSSFTRSFRHQFGYPPGRLRQDQVTRPENLGGDVSTLSGAFDVFVDGMIQREATLGQPALPPGEPLSRTSQERET